MSNDIYVALKYESYGEEKLAIFDYIKRKGGTQYLFTFINSRSGQEKIISSKEVASELECRGWIRETQWKHEYLITNKFIGYLESFDALQKYNIRKMKIENWFKSCKFCLESLS